MHPDAVWVLHDERPPLHGHEEITRFVAAELERLRPDVPEPITSSMTQHGNVVLVNGQLRIPHTGAGASWRCSRSPGSTRSKGTRSRA